MGVTGSGKGEGGEGRVRRCALGYEIDCMDFSGVFPPNSQRGLAPAAVTEPKGKASSFWRRPASALALALTLDARGNGVARKVRGSMTVNFTGVVSTKAPRRGGSTVEAWKLPR